MFVLLFNSGKSVAKEGPISLYRWKSKFSLPFISMKSNYLVKTILLALPVIILIYVFVIRDRIDTGSGGVGGGGYDLTKMYTLVTMGLYLLILNLVLLIQVARENWIFLLVGIALFSVTVVMAVRSF